MPNPCTAILWLLLLGGSASVGAAELLDAVARGVGTVGEDVGVLAGNLVAAQSAAAWLVQRVRDPQTLAVLKPLALVMLSGHAAFGLVWLLFRGLHRAIGTRRRSCSARCCSGNWPVRGSRTG